MRSSQQTINKINW